MKLSTVFLIFTILGSMPALADSHTGKITKYHLNSKAVNRGVCIRMEPEISVGNKWACLNDRNMHLYSEMTSLILSGYVAKATCTIFWDDISGDGSAHANINIVECD